MTVNIDVLILLGKQDCMDTEHYGWPSAGTQAPSPEPCLVQWNHTGPTVRETSTLKDERVGFSFEA